MQKVYTSLTMFLRKTSSNPQKLMPFKVFQHNPKISTRSKAIRLGSKIATYLLLTPKNLRFPTFLLKIPNWNPADTLWKIRFFCKKYPGKFAQNPGKTLGNPGKMREKFVRHPGYPSSLLTKNLSTTVLSVSVYVM